MTSAEDFDRWYADRAASPLADDLVRRTLGLPPHLDSTSLLGGTGLDEVVAALRPGARPRAAGPGVRPRRVRA
ncbi:hypothetical protein PV646_15820 [Streptomyces sp. ID05-26A]|nr:hypothetical protein [Streptomyces sp. ID05-26A]